MLVLSGKTYTNENPYKISSIKFINDSICIYLQEFLCDLDTQFRKTIVVCYYQINKDKIILKNSSTHPDSINSTCFKLPDKEISKCKFLEDELNTAKVLIIDDPRFSKLELYGYIDNITTDTLFYKKKTIYYGKRNKCCHPSIYILKPFHEIK
jgi:hypothetical protein